MDDASVRASATIPVRGEVLAFGIKTIKSISTLPAALPLTRWGMPTRRYAKR
jgi:hypothetical protein